MSAIKAVLLTNDIHVDEDTFLLRSLTKSCCLHHDRVHLRFPIHKDLLHALLKALSDYFLDKSLIYLVNLYLSLFSTAYYGLFRIDEIMKGDHVIKACDVHIGTNKDKLLFILRTSKTHGLESYPQTIKIVSRRKDNMTNKTPDPFCLYQLLWNYLRQRRSFLNDGEQFFVFCDRSPVLQHHFCDVLKIPLTSISVNPLYYSGHSMRIGCAGDLLKLGLSVETIKKIGRWKSNCVYCYLWSFCYLPSFSLIVVWIHALQSVWILGGDFLRELSHMFTSMKTETKREGHKTLYLHLYYNVHMLLLPQLSNMRSYLARVYNELIKTLNDKSFEYHLPRYLIILLDRDLISKARVFDYGVTKTLEDIIKWLLININRAIELRKEDMYGKCPGSLTQSSELRLIWIMMLCRPEGSFDRKVNSLTTKFNSILEEVVAGDRRSHILLVQVDSQAAFDCVGNLTQMGIYEYWRNLDFQMKEFDWGKTELQPRKPTSKFEPSKNYLGNASRYKWAKQEYWLYQIAIYLLLQNFYCMYASYITFNLLQF